MEKKSFGFVSFAYFAWFAVETVFAEGRRAFSDLNFMMNTEEFVSIQAAVKAGVAPLPVTSAFNELSTLRAELEKQLSDHAKKADESKTGQ